VSSSRARSVVVGIVVSSSRARSHDADDAANEDAPAVMKSGMAARWLLALKVIQALQNPYNDCLDYTAP
jgi:hypothetical protein